MISRCGPPLFYSRALPGLAVPGPAVAARPGLPATDRSRGVDLVGGDLQDDPALRADGVAVVAAHVLAGELVDVLAGLVPGFRADDPPAYLGPVPRVVGGVDQHGDPGVPADVPGPLPLRLGVHQDVLAVGVHPGQ